MSEFACPHCGTQNRENRSTCWSCGKSLNELPPAREGLPTLRILHRETGAVVLETIALTLQKAELHGANLEGSALAEAELSYVNLRGTSLVGADLARARLKFADLQGADLRGADLTGANLQSANLSAARLQGANLEGANLRYARLEGADLSGTTLAGTNLDSAQFDGGTQWPEGYTAPEPQPGWGTAPPAAPRQSTLGQALLFGFYWIVLILGWLGVAGAGMLCLSGLGSQAGAAALLGGAYLIGVKSLLVGWGRWGLRKWDVPTPPPGLRLADGGFALAYAAGLAIPFPIFLGARAQARAVTCQANLKQIGRAMQMYAQDFDEKLPHITRPVEERNRLGGLETLPPPPAYAWAEAVQPYIKNYQVFTCLEDGRPEAVFQGGSDSTFSYGFNDLGLAGGSLAAVEEPAATVAGVDALSPFANPPGLDPARASRRRHPRGVNVWYLDGHIKAMPEKELHEAGATEEGYPLRAGTIDEYLLWNRR